MIKIGIQGDVGSCNEQVCLRFCQLRGVEDFEIQYLITTENVLRELNQGKIDLGTFAYKSSRGGLVQETQEAMTKYDFKKVDEMDFNVEHALLGLKKMEKNYYSKIISHPQALIEHEGYLNKKFAHCELVAAEDTAIAARRMKDGEYGEDVLVIALKNCAEIYGLEIVEADLPANEGYVTNFWLVEKGR